MITPGAGNDCPVAPGKVVINDLDYDQPMGDTAEFVELKNVSTSPTNLDTFTLKIVNGATTPATVPHQLFDLPNVVLAGGDYFVVCANAANTANCDLDVTPNTDLIQNGPPDAVGLRESGNLVDAVSYEGNTTTRPTPKAPAPASSDAGVTDGLSRCADSVDTDNNDADFELRPITPGLTNKLPGPAGPRSGRAASRRRSSPRSRATERRLRSRASSERSKASSSATSTVPAA